MKKNDKENKILIIKEKIEELNKELAELVKPITDADKKEEEKKLIAVKKKFEKNWVSITDTNDYIYINKVTDINDEDVTINGVLLSIGYDYNEYADELDDICGFEYNISDFKIVKKEKVISELENEKKDRTKYLDKMIKKANSIQ